MIRAFLLSLRLHRRWFYEAFSREGRTLAPLTLHRLAILCLLYPAYLCIQAGNWFGLFLDELFFRGYHRVKITEPLFIVGIPRSGTTFIHRTLAGDDEAFTTFKTWDALFAPSIFQKKTLILLSRLDRLLGHPLHRFVAGATKRFTGKMSHIHSVGLHSPEEDYLTLLPAGACFILMTVFPASRSLWQLGNFAQIGPRDREIILQFYQACLRKHLYGARAGTRLLSKNAAFSSWLPYLQSYFPDARYLICVREPEMAYSSQISSLLPALSFFATAKAAKTVARRMRDVLGTTYSTLEIAVKQLPGKRYVIVEQSHLALNTNVLLVKGLAHLGIPLSHKLHCCIREAATISARHKSRHKHARISSTGKPIIREVHIAASYQEILDKATGYLP